MTEPAPTSAGSNDWQRRLVDRFAFEVLAEQRRSRRWGIFFKLLGLAYLFLLLAAYSGSSWKTGAITAGRHTSLINIQGIISDDADASADNVIGSLREAFEDKNTAAIILRINSPGGSPVQAGYINDEIYRLRQKHPDIKVYAVITDICASGGYYIASAADEIYADKASIVGSIGVLMDGFGFVGTMQKLGVERRLLTAGEHKGLLDPFSPEKPDEVAHIQGLLKEIHDQFINTVKKGRRDRLKLDDPQLFSGLVWTGVQALELGLVDGLGSSSYVAREVIKEEKIVDYTHKQDYFERLTSRMGATLYNSFSRLGEPALLR
ncbi:MAG TPA: S49 family peptidase [Gammaproteobacteria bacterium]|nr:S49 family peptidase [Gammaproteobacteria bacterium]